MDNILGYTPYKSFGGDRFEDLFGENPKTIKNNLRLKRILKTCSSNFKVLEERINHLLVEHCVTRERKWVLKTSLIEDGMANAFYDADPRLVDPWYGDKMHDKTYRGQQLP